MPFQLTNNTLGFKVSFVYMYIEYLNTLANKLIDIHIVILIIRTFAKLIQVKPS